MCTTSWLKLQFVWPKFPPVPRHSLESRVLLVLQSSEVSFTPKMQSFIAVRRGLSISNSSNRVIITLHSILQVFCTIPEANSTRVHSSNTLHNSFPRQLLSLFSD